MPNPTKKTPTKTSKTKPPAPLVVPIHGRGALRVGNPGNVGGTGRPPSEIRERMRGSLAARIHIAEEIAENKNANDADRLKALDLLAKYGLGTTTTETDTDGNDVTVRVVRQPRRAVG